MTRYTNCERKTNRRLRVCRVGNPINKDAENQNKNIDHQGRVQPTDRSKISTMSQANDWECS